MLPPGALLEIDYGHIVRDQEGARRRLIAFADLPWDDEVLRCHAGKAPSASAALQVRWPVAASSVGKWRPMPTDWRRCAQRLLRELLEAELG